MIRPSTSDKYLSAGTVHDLTEDLREVLDSSPDIVKIWEDITPLARNEWICWIGDARKPETRKRRIARLTVELREGKRRPCCWAGCPHRHTSEGERHGGVVL